MASKSVIETNKLKVGSSGMTGLYVGSTESKYAVMTDSAKTQTVIYDKVTYNFTVKDIATTVPASGGTYVVTATTTTRTHGNGAVDQVAFSPTSITINANTSTSTVTGSKTITQTTSNLTDAVDYTQEADAVTAVTLTLGTPSVIPASGGSVNSTTYSMTAYYKSGRNETKTSGLTINWTGVTASSKGTTISNQTSAGTLSASTTYSGVTASATKTVYQAGNYVTAISVGSAAVSYNKIPASGGTVSDGGSNGSVTYTFSSTSTSTTAPASTYGEITSGKTYTMTNGNGFTLASTSTGNVSASSKGTTISNETASNTVTKTVTWTWAPTASYNAAGTKTTSTSPTTTVKQNPNYVTAVNFTPTVSYSTVAASGGTANDGGGNGTVTYTFSSTSTSTTAPASTYGSLSTSKSYSMTTSGTFTAINTSSGAVTVGSKGTTISNQTSSNTVTKTVTQTFTHSSTYSGGGAPTATKTATTTVKQSPNYVVSATATTSTTGNGHMYYASTIAASGGTASPTLNGAVTVTYSSNSTEKRTSAKTGYSISWGRTYSMTTSGTFTAINATYGAVTVASKGTTISNETSSNTVTSVLTPVITHTTDYSAGGTVTASSLTATSVVKQAANYVTALTVTTNPAVSYGGCVVAKGGTASDSGTNGAVKYTFTSTSTAATAPSSTYGALTITPSYSMTTSGTFTAINSGNGNVTVASKGTSISCQTTSNTITKSVSYSWAHASAYSGGGTVTKSASATGNVCQKPNVVTAISFTPTVSYSCAAASGGTVSDGGGNGSVTYTFSSTSTSATAPGSTYGSLSSSKSYSMTTSGTFTAINASSGAVTIDSKGTTISCQTNSNTITKSVTQTWTPTSTYTGCASTVTATKTATTTACQNANFVTAIAVASNPTVNYGSCVSAGGGTASDSGGNGGVTFTFSSTSTSATAPGSSYGTLTPSKSYSMTTGGTFTAINASTGAITVGSKGTTIGCQTNSNTVTKTVNWTWAHAATYNNCGASNQTASGSNTGTACQAANFVVSVTAKTEGSAAQHMSYAASSTAVGAGGGTVTPTLTGSNQGTFSSGSKATISTSIAGISSVTYTRTYSMTTSGTFTAINASSGAVTVASKGTNLSCETTSNPITSNLVVTVKHTSTYNNCGAADVSSAALSATATIKQEPNYVTGITVTCGTFGYGSCIGAAGGTKSISTNNTNSYSIKYKSGSSSATAASSTGVSYSMTTAGTFTGINTSTGAVTVGSRGTTVGDQTSRTVTKTYTVSFNQSSYTGCGATATVSNSASQTASVCQAANAITGISVTAGTFAYSTFPAGGDLQGPSTNNTNSWQAVYSSGSKGTPASNSFDYFETEVSYSLPSRLNDFNIFDTESGEIEASDRGTTPGAARTSDTIAKTYWVNLVLYNGDSLSGSDTKTATATQEANYITGVTTNCGTYSYATAAANGGTITPTSTASYTVTYKSGSEASSVSSTYYTASASTSYSGSTGNGVTALNTTTGAITWENRTTTPGCARTSNTFTKTYSITITPVSGKDYGNTGALSNSCTKTASGGQSANCITSVTATCGNFQYASASAAGGDVTPTSNANSYKVTYSSTSTAATVSSTYYTESTSVTYGGTVGSGITAINSGSGKVTWSSRGTTPGAALSNTTLTKTFSVTLTPKSVITGCCSTVSDSKTIAPKVHPSQNANYITGVTAICGSFSYGTAAAGGQTLTPTNHANSYIVKYASNSTATIVSSTYYTATQVQTFSGTTGNGLTAISSSDGKTTWANRGEIPGLSRSKSITKTYTITITPVSGKDYGRTGALSNSCNTTASTQQECNYITGVTVYMAEFSYDTASASGGTYSPEFVDGNEYAATFKSGLQSNEVDEDYFDVAYTSTYSSTTSSGATINSSNGDVTWENRCTTSGASRSVTVTHTISVSITPVSSDYGCGNTNAVTGSGQRTATCAQAANVITNTQYSAHSYTATISIGNGVTCAGGNATVTLSANHKVYDLYTSGCYNNEHTITDTADWYVDSVAPSSTSASSRRWGTTTDANNITTSSSGSGSFTLYHKSMGTASATDSITLRVRNHSNTATTNTASKSVSNSVTSTTWNNPSITISYATIPASGGTACPSTTITQSGTAHYCSGSDAVVSNDLFTIAYSGGGGTGFGSANASTGCITASNRGSTTGSSRCSNTITISVTGQGITNSATATACQDANTTWIDWGSVSINSFSYGSCVSAGGGTASPSWSASQTGTRWWDSGSSAATSQTVTTHSFSGGGGTGFGTANSSTGNMSVSSRGTTTGGTRYSSYVTLSVTGSSSPTASTTASTTARACQEANETWIENQSLSVTTTSSDIPACGGSRGATLSTSTLYYGVYYTSSGNTPYRTMSSNVYSSTVFNSTSVSASNQGTTTSSRHSAGTATWTASYEDSNGAVSTSGSQTIYQAANAITTGTSTSTGVEVKANSDVINFYVEGSTSTPYLASPCGESVQLTADSYHQERAYTANTPWSSWTCDSSQHYGTTSYNYGNYYNVDNSVWISKDCTPDDLTYTVSSGCISNAGTGSVQLTLDISPVSERSTLDSDFKAYATKADGGTMSSAYKRIRMDDSDCCCSHCSCDEVCSSQCNPDQWCRPQCACENQCQDDNQWSCSGHSSTCPTYGCDDDTECEFYGCGKCEPHS